MWAKSEFDKISREKDFSFLRKELELRSPDLTRVLPHILGKCKRNVEYNKLAKAELLVLATKHEPLKIALLAIFSSVALSKAAYASEDTENQPQKINRFAKL